MCYALGMTESQMQTFFRDYLALNPPKESEVYELKISKKRSLEFDRVKEHQIEALLGVGDGLFHKITDPPMFYGSQTRFNKPRPFDCFYLRDVKGYLIVWFYVPRQKKVFYKIPIVKFITLRDNANRKSFTEEMISEIGEKLYL